jgi:hypothetical protein
MDGVDISHREPGFDQDQGWQPLTRGTRCRNVDLASRQTDRPMAPIVRDPCSCRLRAYTGRDDTFLVGLNGR